MQRNVLVRLRELLEIAEHHLSLVPIFKSLCMVMRGVTHYLNAVEIGNT